MTIDLCNSACGSVYYTHAGVENGVDCYCGNKIPDLNPLPSQECDIQCPGNATQICGGDEKMNIYSLQSKCQLDTTQDIACEPSGAYVTRQCNYDLESTFCWCVTTEGDEISGTQIYPFFKGITIDDVFCPEYYVGECVLDDKSNPILTGHSFEADDMTQEKCKSTCESMEFNYAGVEDANFCFCGLEIPDLKFLPSPECNLECVGNPNEMCGGNEQMNIFTLSPIFRNFPNATNT